MTDIELINESLRNTGLIVVTATGTDTKHESCMHHELVEIYNVMVVSKGENVSCEEHAWSLVQSADFVMHGRDYRFEMCRDDVFETHTGNMLTAFIVKMPSDRL